MAAESKRRTRSSNFSIASKQAEFATSSKLTQLFRGKNGVGLSDIKSLFGQYLDIVISDADIIEFIQESDTDHDGVLDKNDFCSK